MTGLSVGIVGALLGSTGGGGIAPVVVVDGQPVQPCALRVWPTSDHAAIREGGSSVTGLPPGAYDVEIRCGEGDEIAAVTRVRVAANKTATPKLKLTWTRLRVMAKRGGAVRPASVSLFAVGQLDSRPLYTQPANQKFKLVDGRYDAVVTLQTRGKKGPKPQIRLKNLRVKGSRVVEAEARFADGVLVVGVTENGRRAEGIVRVFAWGETTALGQHGAGEKIDLAPGRYRVETTLGSSADFSKQTDDLWIDAKKTQKLSARFSTGRLSVRLTHAKKPIEGNVQIAVFGATESFNYFETPGPAVLSPGRYEISIEPKGAVAIPTQTRTVDIKAKGHTQLALDLTPAKLVVQVMRAGRPVEVEQIRLNRAGGGEEAAKPNFDGEYELWPGRYEIQAQLVNGDTMTDGPFPVDFGQKITRTLKLPHGMLSISATRANKAVPSANIFVYRPGAAKPTAKAKGSAVLALSPGVYDVKIVMGPSVKWKEGVRVAERHNTKITVDLGAAGSVESDSDLPAGDDELPEGDAPPEQKPKKKT